MPPKGISTEAEPMDPSNRSVRPRREPHFRLAAISFRVWKFSRPMAERSALATEMAACFTAPLVSKKARDRSAMVWPFQCMTMRGLAVTTATR